MAKIKTLARWLILPLLLISLLFVILFQRHLPSKLNPYLYQLLKQPLNPKINQTLALQFTQLQSQLADQFIQRASVLSTESDWQQLNTSIQRFKSQQTSLQNQIKYWQNLDLKYPNFPSLKLILSTLYLKLQDPQTAQKYLNQAKQLDPNNPLIDQIQQIINNQ